MAQAELLPRRRREAPDEIQHHLTAGQVYPPRDVDRVVARAPDRAAEVEPQGPAEAGRLLQPSVDGKQADGSARRNGAVIDDRGADGALPQELSARLDVQQPPAGVDGRRSAGPDVERAAAARAADVHRAADDVEPGAGAGDVQASVGAGGF